MSIREILENSEVSLQERIKQGREIVSQVRAKLLAEEKISSLINDVMTRSEVGSLVNDTPNVGPKKVTVLDNVEVYLNKFKSGEELSSIVSSILLEVNYEQIIEYILAFIHSETMVAEKLLSGGVSSEDGEVLQTYLRDLDGKRHILLRALSKDEDRSYMEKAVCNDILFNLSAAGNPLAISDIDGIAREYYPEILDLILELQRIDFNEAFTSARVKRLTSIGSL